MGISQYHLSCQKLFQNAAATLLTDNKNEDNITPTLDFLHWLLFQYAIEFKVLLFCF